MAVKACKVAWKKLEGWCKAHRDDKAKEACQQYETDPKEFLLERVLRATVNPIDAAYRYAACAPWMCNCAELLGHTL